MRASSGRARMSTTPPVPPPPWAKRWPPSGLSPTLRPPPSPTPVPPALSPSGRAPGQPRLDRGRPPFPHNGEHHALGIEVDVGHARGVPRRRVHHIAIPAQIRRPVEPRHAADRGPGVAAVARLVPALD